MWHNAGIFVPSELNDPPPYQWMHRHPPYAWQLLSSTPWWICPMPGEFLPLALPSHPHHCYLLRRPWWLFSGCANPHLQQHEPMLGELLLLGLPSHHLHCLVLMWHHRAVGDHRSACPWPKSVKDWGQCPSMMNISWCGVLHASSLFWVS